MQIKMDALRQIRRFIRKIQQRRLARGDKRRVERFNFDPLPRVPVFCACSDRVKTAIPVFDHVQRIDPASQLIERPDAVPEYENRKSERR